MVVIKYDPVDKLEKNTTAYKELNVKIKNKHRDLWEMADQCLEDIKAHDMKDLVEKIHTNTKMFRTITVNLYEIRIPPQSKRGVIRIYFSFAEDSSHIIIIEVEYKNETKSKKLENAKKRQRGMS